MLLILIILFRFPIFWLFRCQEDGLVGFVTFGNNPFISLNIHHIIGRDILAIQQSVPKIRLLSRLPPYLKSRGKLFGAQRGAGGAILKLTRLVGPYIRAQALFQALEINEIDLVCQGVNWRFIHPSSHSNGLKLLLAIIFDLTALANALFLNFFTILIQ